MCSAYALDASSRSTSRLVRVGCRVGDERVDLGERRRQARQRQRHAIDQRFLVGRAGGSQAFALQPRENEAIDLVARFAGARDVRHRRALRRDERPMLAIFGAVLDPLLEDRHLLWRQHLVRRLGRHALVDVRRANPVHELAAIRIARHDRALARCLRQLGDGELAQIEPQPGLPRRRVGAVTLEAVLGEDRADVPVVVDRVGRESAEIGVRCRAAEEGSYYGGAGDEL